MIISASYKTDIPAFYGEWFRNRMKAGFCEVVNPYGGKTFRVPLDRENAEAFVFWTRDASPFLGTLAGLKEEGFPFVVQYTLTGYPGGLDGTVPAPERGVTTMKALAKAYGPRAVVWRYDPLILSNLTPVVFHLKNFRGLCRQLKGSVDEVVVSFVQPYQKTVRNLGKIGGGFGWGDPVVEEKRGLLVKMAKIAAGAGMGLSLCAQRGLMVKGARDGSCVDLARLSELAGLPVGKPGRGHRINCGCAPSKDIGAYDTCPFGCAYCYASRSREYALKRLENHDPAAETL